MLKKLELLNPDSCLNKALATEPIFVIRAKDPLAVATVNHWISISTGIHETEKLQKAKEWLLLADNWFKTQSAT